LELFGFPPPSIREERKMPTIDDVIHPKEWVSETCPGFMRKSDKDPDRRKSWGFGN